MRQRLGRAGQGRVIALLALALLVRALVPTGWMPVATADGFGIVLCAGQAPVPHAMAGMHHGSGKQDGPAVPDHPCAFAGLGLAADTAPPPLVLPMRPVAVVAAAVPVLVVAVGQGLAAPPPPATGPPPFA